MSPEDTERWARLVTLCAISEAQIKANPLPILSRLAEKMYRLERAAEDAMIALMGADDFDLARKYEPLLPVDLVQTALMRNQKALTILRRAVEDKPEGGE